MTYTLQLETPVGPVTITATGEAVTQIRFGTAVPEGSAAVPETAATPLLLKAAAQLREYFAGTRRDFSHPASSSGCAEIVASQSTRTTLSEWAAAKLLNASFVPGTQDTGACALISTST